MIYDDMNKSAFFSQNLSPCTVKTEVPRAQNVSTIRRYMPLWKFFCIALSATSTLLFSHFFNNHEDILNIFSTLLRFFMTYAGIERTTESEQCDHSALSRTLRISECIAEYIRYQWLNYWALYFPRSRGKSSENIFNISLLLLKL